MDYICKRVINWNMPLHHGKRKRKRKMFLEASLNYTKLHTLWVLENLEHHRVNCMGLVEWACSATEQLCCPGHISSPPLGFICFHIFFQRLHEGVSFWIAKAVAVCIKHSLLAPSTVQLQHCQWCGLEGKENQPMLETNGEQWRAATGEVHDVKQKPVLFQPIKDLEVLLIDLSLSLLCKMSGPFCISLLFLGFLGHAPKLHIFLFCILCL